MTRHRPFQTSFFVAVFLLLAGTVASAGERALVVSTLPFDSPAEQKAVFATLSRHLTAKLGRPVRFEAGESYDVVIDRLSQGKTDVAFLGATAYVKARRTGGVRAILRSIRHQHSTYFGIIVVPRGSPIKKIADLKGKRVAFVNRNSGAGYLFPSLLLKAAGIDPATDIIASFAGGHHSVVKKVAAGEVDAGACFEGAQNTLVDPESVTPIARTEPIPGDPVVVRSGLGVDLIRSLRSAMIEMATLPDARPFFTYSEIDAFVPAFDGDYDRVAELVQRMK